MHFVFGLEPQDAPFHLLHYLAIASCLRVLEPDEIRLHVHHLPYGIYWDLARPLVRLERIEPVAGVDAATPEELRPWIYARHADVIRLDVLDRDGGLYADIDTLFHAPVPAELWERPAVIGHEDPVQYPDAPAPEPSVTNALVLARPGAPFIREWRERILGAMDGSWSGHSCRLATRLAAEHPEWVTVVPAVRFSPYPHTVEGLRALLEEPLQPGALDATWSVHLMAHLWWHPARRDFTTFSFTDATEARLGASSTPLGVLARPDLPNHALF